jgi:hypothetical protein
MRTIIKSLSTLSLSFVLLFTMLFNLNVYAASVSSDGTIQTSNNDVKSKITELSQKYNLELDFSPKTIASEKAVNFNTVEEYETFVKERQTLNKTNNLNNVNTSKSASTIINSTAGTASTASIVTLSNHVAKYAPFKTGQGISFYQNIVFQYTIDGSFIGPAAPILSSTVTNSYATGITVGVWTYMYGNSSVQGSKHAINVNSTGKFEIVGTVAGIPVGTSWTETWYNTWSQY